VLPELERDWKRIDVELLPPCGFITRAMKLAVVDPANRDDEFVAHSVSKRTRLGKREVMRIRRHAAAHKTRLPQHELPVVLIAQANGFAQSTDHRAARPLFAPFEAFWLVSASARRRPCLQRNVGQRKNRNRPSSIRSDVTARVLVANERLRATLAASQPARGEFWASQFEIPLLLRPAPDRKKPAALRVHELRSAMISRTQAAPGGRR
jgi:hypothetical protein